MRHLNCWVLIISQFQVFVILIALLKPIYMHEGDPRKLSIFVMHACLHDGTWLFFVLLSTAVGQVITCVPVMQRAWVRSPVGTSFLGQVFWGFSPPVRQMSGSFRSPNIILPSLSSSLRAPMT